MVSRIPLIRVLALDKLTFDYEISIYSAEVQSLTISSLQPKWTASESGPFSTQFWHRVQPSPDLHSPEPPNHMPIAYPFCLGSNTRWRYPNQTYAAAVTFILHFDQT